MRVRFRRLKILAAALGVFAAFVYLNNTSWLADPIADRPFLVAHRALGQGFELEGLTGATCTASTMLPVRHGYLENTIPAMQAAFDYGADVVEFDVHRTVDGRFAVFHDWTVDCRTESNGVTREHTGSLSRTGLLHRRQEQRPGGRCVAGRTAGEADREP